jgi:protein-tyrosine phosphatase
MFYNISSVCSVNGSKDLGEIFISDAQCAIDKRLLKALNINYILNAAENEVRTGREYYRDIGAEYMGIKLVDVPEENISLYFDQVADFIHHCLSQRGKIVVHCVMGISRSAACVIAYLIKYCGKDTFEAITFLRQKRGIINPNPGFIKQLQKFQLEQN